MPNFVEENCTITHEGKEFISGGAWIADCTDGYRRGVVYASPTKKCVTDWHGNKIADAVFGPIYQGNYCKMQSVSFIVDGVKFSGRYCPDWACAVRVRSTKRVSCTTA
jgi:hypothetical protein